MANRRALAAGVGLAVILGGAATAVAAMTGSSTPAAVESTLPDPASTETETTIADPSNVTPRDDAEESIPVIDQATSSNDDRGPTDLAPAPSADEAGLASESPAPEDLSGEGDSDSGTSDGSGIGFRVEGMSFGTLVSLARSVGITMDEPVTAEDGSITVAITLPDASVHTVWIAFDADRRISDAAVDGIPIGEFVRQFLAGKYDQGSNLPG